jgi:hypothetical protein
LIFDNPSEGRFAKTSEPLAYWRGRGVEAGTAGFVFVGAEVVVVTVVVVWFTRVALFPPGVVGGAVVEVAPLPVPVAGAEVAGVVLVVAGTSVPVKTAGIG